MSKKQPMKPVEAEAAIASGDIGFDLEPPGYKRDEQLAQRKDDLEQQAEEVSNEMEHFAVDPKALEKDREIQDFIAKDALDVEDPQPGYVYKWVPYVHSHGNAVFAAKAQGWEVVEGNMPESLSLRAVDGSRRVGDVLLMRIRMDYHLKLQMLEDKKRLTRMYGAEAALYEIQRKYPELFPDVDTELQPSPQLRSTTTRRAARRVAAQAVGNRMKQGTIPGIPIPGQR